MNKYFAHHEDRGFILATGEHTRGDGYRQTWEIQEYDLEEVPEGYKAVPARPMNELILAGYKGWHLQTMTQADYLMEKILTTERRCVNYWELWQMADKTLFDDKSFLMSQAELMVSGDWPLFKIRHYVALITLNGRAIRGDTIVPWQGVLHTYEDGVFIGIYEHYDQCVAAIQRAKADRLILK